MIEATVFTGRMSLCASTGTEDLPGTIHLHSVHVRSKAAVGAFNLILMQMHALSLFSHRLWCPRESCKRASDCFWRHHFWFHCAVYLQQGVCPHWCKVSDMPRGQAVVSSSTNLQMYVMSFYLCWNLLYMHFPLSFMKLYAMDTCNSFFLVSQTYFASTWAVLTMATLA